MGNKLENRLQNNPVLLGSIEKCKAEATLLLNKYLNNFPEYTDHSIEHTQHVCDLASYLLNDDEIENLNDDEIYVLCMACYLHDIGMCLPEDKIELFRNSSDFFE